VRILVFETQRLLQSRASINQSHETLPNRKALAATAPAGAS
jgi:hypothetical protein